MNIKDIIKGLQGFSLPLLTRQEMIKSKINRNLYLTALGFSSCVNQYLTKGKVSPQQYMLIYCVEGLGFIDLGNSKYEQSQDEFIIFPEGISHLFFTSFTDPWRIYWVGFNGELADDLYKRGSSNSGVMACKVSYDENRLTVFNRIYRVLSQSYTSDDLELANFQLTYFITSLIYDNGIKSSSSDEDPINASVIL